MAASAWTPVDENSQASGWTPVDEATPAQAQPAQSPSLLSKAGAVGSNLIQGIGEGALDTVHGVGEGIRKGLNLIHSGAGDAVVPPTGQASLKQIATPDNTTQKVGKTAEDIGEFFLGDEALKGISLGDKAMKAAGLAEKYEKASPFAKAAIEHVLNGARGGVVAGAETTNKTGDIKQGAEAGLGAAAGSAVLSGASDLIGSGLKYVRAAGAFKELPGALDKGLADVVSQKAVADGLKATTGDTAAEHLADSALQYKARAKAAYQMVDNAVDGELQPIQDKLTQTKKAIKVNSELNPELADKLRTQQTVLEKQLASTIEKAKRNGVPDADQVIKDADRDYSKFRAQSDLSTDLTKKGGANGPASPAGLHVWSKKGGTPAIVGGVSKLENALGKDGAEAVQTLASEGRAKAEELARQAAVGRDIKVAAAKGAGYAAGAGGTGYLGYRILSGGH